MKTLNLLQKKPSLLNALKLCCPYCGTEKLIKGKTWFVFRDGCETCNYRYEREIGYFTGASWMINFPATGTFGFLLATYLVIKTDLKSMPLALITSGFVLLFCLVFFPFSQGIWMVLEQSFHPLNDEDILKKFEES